ncbi:MAG: polysulfide reductase NrfD, partial [Chloroflexi bacterium]|nr:polysulfide reductase NrfD [Chloroflexota bacterium]
MRQKTLTLAYWTLLGVIAIVGIAAIYIRAVQGLKVTNLNSLVPWGLWVAFYIYFIGLSAGSFLISTMIYVFGLKRFEPIGRLALFAAFIALSTGLTFILIDLGHMERFWTVYVNRSATSVLQWEMQFYTLYLVILLAELWLLIRRDLIRRGEQKDWIGRVCRILTFGSKDLSDESAAKDMRMVKILGTLGVPVAIGVHGGTGAIFAVVKARPYWYTGLFPLIFIVSALASGGALLTFIYAFFGRKDEEHAALVTSLGKMVAGFLALDLIFLTSELLVGLYGSVPDHVAVYRSIMFGPFWYVFWIGQLGLGALVPLFLVLNRRTGASVGWVGVAAALIVVGIVGVRLNIVIPPFTVPLMPGVDTAYPLGRFSTFDFTGFAGALFGLAILVFVIAAGLITARLSQLPAKAGERWLARAAGLVVMAGFVVMGLRFLGYTTPETATLLGTPARLPLFFGGSVRATDATFYSPSAIEWLSSMGVISLAAMGFSLGWLALPLEGEPEAAR